MIDVCLSLIDWLVQERKLVDCYLLSHEAPPDHKWPAPICCRVCGFTACCVADVRKDAEELGLMSDVKRRQWQAEQRDGRRRDSGGDEGGTGWC